MKKKVIGTVIVGMFLLIQPLKAQTWGATKRLSWTLGSSSKSKIAVDSSNMVHVVWYDFVAGNSEIYYRKSTNSGGTWSGTKRLSWNPGWSNSPGITVDSADNIHVVWHDHTPGNYEILYRKSANGGGTWGGTKRLTWNGGNSRFPAITKDSSGNIHVVWSDDTPGNEEIYYKRSTDDGVSWGGTKRLSWNSEFSTIPKIAVDSSDNIHVVWYDKSSGNYEIYHKRSTNGGVSWSGTKRFTWKGNSFSPSIATNTSNTVYVVWTHFFDELYYRKSTDGGGTWGGAKRLTWNSGESCRPAIAIDSSSNIHIVWEDDTPGNYEIYYKRSTNGGSSWTTKRLSWNPVESEWPAVATDSSNNIHVVWEDYSPGNYEIYYKKGIQ